ncbi:hypothetical protein [Algoriphagus sediminis]|uniref:Uncharacterized protein n=1 Tax=Algoriphagus sediminis TaxID=3057113 RepID=A0ABT7YDC0_9BACT|nr:hypothetical protein [Algoriphagus sediminis]MDN3204531.1 hypothetical protein [Algoriphagus sediminis]
MKPTYSSIVTLIVSLSILLISSFTCSENDNDLSVNITVNEAHKEISVVTLPGMAEAENVLFLG